MRKDKALPMAIREEGYEFDDPRPEEMKHVNIITLSPSFIFHSELR